MSSRFRLPDYIDQIEQAAQNIQKFTEGLQKQDFLDHAMAQNAVMMSLIVMGESTKKIMDSHPDFIDEHPDSPWYLMRGMRNQIAHGYFDVDQNMIWKTVREGIPVLLEQIPNLRRDALEMEDDQDFDGP